MKTKSFLSIFLLLVLASYSSCDLLDKADDVAFDATLPVSFTINETASNPEGKSYTDSKLLDATSDAEIAKYANKIKEFKINKITYTISNANPNTVNFTNGSIKVASSGKVIATASAVDLANASEIELIADTAGFNELAANLLNDKQELVQLSGMLSSTPVYFNVQLKFYVTIKADALK
jgi:hypothetical protein